VRHGFLFFASDRERVGELVKFGRPRLPGHRDVFLGEAPPCQQDFKKSAADNLPKEILRVARQTADNPDPIGKNENPLTIALVGLAISFVLPTLAQQKDAPDPELRQKIDGFAKEYAEAVNNGPRAKDSQRVPSLARRFPLCEVLSRVISFSNQSSLCLASGLTPSLILLCKSQRSS
jgi:hypothetical protein